VLPRVSNPAAFAPFRHFRPPRRDPETGQSRLYLFGNYLNPNVAKAGGLQSQGVRGDAVISYRNPMATQDLKSSGFPEG